MTFSIAARSADARYFGIAIASSSPAVGARCVHARAGCGAVATQNITDPSLGPRILDGLARGLGARAALDDALRSTPYAEYRQLIVVGRQGPLAAHTGGRALGLHASAVHADAASAGNLLANTRVPGDMVRAFDAALAAGAGRGANGANGANGTNGTKSAVRAALIGSAAELGACLLTSLRAGLASGGEAGPVHSAALLIVHDVSWPVVDLRVDWDEADPIGALEALWARYAPQIDAYIDRARNPTHAPSFGVPGEA
jgi:uncharacterized Ntn-hydrolase superfamily protein